MTKEELEAIFQEANKQIADSLKNGPLKEQIEEIASSADSHSISLAIANAARASLLVNQEFLFKVLSQALIKP